MSSGVGATGTTADSTSTEFLLGWAFHTEVKLKEELAQCTRFPLRNASLDELERIERFYGAFLSHQLTAGAVLDELISAAPYLAVTTLVHRASTMIDQSSFYEEYLSGLALPADEQNVEAVATAAARVIEQSGLDVSAGVVADPVLFFAAHAGITAAEIPAVLELMDSTEGDEPIDVGTLATSEGIPVTSAVAHAAPDLLGEVIASVDAFRRFTATQGATWRVRTQDWPEPAMPEPVRSHVVAELRERPVGTAERLTAVGVGTRELCPRIIWDASRSKICLRLPEQKVTHQPNGEIQWRVSVDDTTKVYRTGTPWGDNGSYSEALDITVAHQTREVAVHDVSTELSWVVPVVASEDPLLIFTPKGANVTDKASLHYPELFVVCPEDARVVDVVAGRELPVISTSSVEGWEKWHCVHVDTQDAASVSIQRQETGADNPANASTATHVRCVNARQRVVFRDPSPAIAGVRTLTGLPVHSESLIAEFPPTLSGADETWYLTISAYAGIGEEGMEVAPAEPLEVPADGGVFDIFDPSAWDSPWVGEYLIRLRGPRNESFRHEYALVEGMVTEGEVADGTLTFRIPAHGGLSSARLRIRHGEKPFAVVPKRVEVSPDSAGVDFAVTTDEGDQLPLRFTPPRLLFELPLRTQASHWRTTRALVHPQEWDTAGDIRLRIPAGGGITQPTVSIRNNHGTPLRTVKMTPQDSCTFTVSMETLTGSLKAMPSGRMDLEWVDKAANRKVSVGLADIAPTELATGVVLEEGALVFENLTTSHRVGAWIWPLSAPWALARTIPEVAPTTTVPEDFVGAGDLCVQLFSSDPYNPQRPARAPHAHAFVVKQEGYLRSGSQALTELSAFVAGESEHAPQDASIMPVLWEYLGSAVDADSPAHGALRSAVLAHPGAAIAGLASSLVPSEHQPAMVISTGLVYQQFSTSYTVSTEEAVSAADKASHSASVGEASEIHRNAWLGILNLLAELPSLASAAEQSGADVSVRPRLRALERQLETVAGKRLIEALSTGRDATLDTSCIDRSTVHIAQMDEAQQSMLLDMFFSQAEIVPGPMMADSTRLLAVFDTFTHRERLAPLLLEHELIKPALALLRALKGAHRRLYNSARIRFDKLDGVDTDNPENLWALTPVISLVFALAARMHAHGLLGKEKLLQQVAPGWAEIARVVPDLVAGDVVASEAMVLGELYPSLAG